MKYPIWIVASSVLGLNTFADVGVLALGGLNFANSTMDPPPGYLTQVGNGYRTGINLTLLGEAPVCDIIQILMGGGVENKGRSVHYTETDNIGTHTVADAVNFDYLVIPVLMALEFPVTKIRKESAVKYFIDAGFEPSFLLSATSNYSIDGAGTSMDILKETNPFDLDLCGDIGGNIPLSKTLNGILAVGYSYGLYNWDKSSIITESHNYVVKFFAGLKFNLTRR